MALHKGVRRKRRGLVQHLSWPVPCPLGGLERYCSLPIRAPCQIKISLPSSSTETALPMGRLPALGLTKTAACQPPSGSSLCTNKNQSRLSLTSYQLMVITQHIHHPHTFETLTATALGGPQSEVPLSLHALASA